MGVKLVHVAIHERWCVRDIVWTQVDLSWASDNSWQGGGEKSGGHYDGVRLIVSI